MQIPELTPDSIQNADALANLSGTLKDLQAEGRGTDFSFRTTGGLNVITHDMGRVPTGFVLVKSNGDVRLWTHSGRDWTPTVAFLEDNSADKYVTVRFF